MLFLFATHGSFHGWAFWPHFGHEVVVVEALCHIFKRDEVRPPNPQTPHSRFGAGPVSSVSNRAFLSVEVTLHQVADHREIDWWLVGTVLVRRDLVLFTTTTSSVSLRRCSALSAA